MPTITAIIDKEIVIEGGEVNDSQDRGGRTKYGISEAANPEAWKDGPPTLEASRAIFLKKYVEGPHFDLIPDPQLQAQLVDFGVNSGPGVAVKKLQAILHVEVDGILGAATLTALSLVRAEEVNALLVAARVRMIGKIVSANPSQLKFLNGWLDRALQFLE